MGFLASTDRHHPPASPRQGERHERSCSSHRRCCRGSVRLRLVHSAVRGGRRVGRGAGRRRLARAAHVVGRPGDRRHLHEQGRERHAVRAARRSSREAARGFRSGRDGGTERAAARSGPSARADDRRQRRRGHGRRSTALVRASRRRERASVVRRRAGERQDSAVDRGRPGASSRATRGNGEAR